MPGMNQLLVDQINSIIDPSLPLISNLSNASAVLNTVENLNWAGFYLVEGNELILGPFQGEIACTRIPCGKGVCGTSMERKETIVVPNVLEFPGHIACSSASRSEIVTPILKDGEVVAVIDIDSPIFNRFTDDDKDTLEKISKNLAKLF